MVRAQTALVLMGALLIGANLYAEPSLMGAASGASAGEKPADPSTLSTRELQQRVEKLGTVLNDYMQHAQVAQARARKSKDILKLNCVNDGLLVTKQLLNVGDDARSKFDKAVQSNDHGEQIAQFNALQATATSCDQSKQGIDACVGSSEVIVTGPDGSKVSVIKPNVKDNPTADCNNLGLSNCASEKLEYVGYASPFSPN